MFLFTPARLRALTWLGAFVTLVLMTEGTCTWGQYRDAYSRTPLPDEQVCELARASAMTDTRSGCTVVERTDLALHARVQRGDGEPIEVCLLKAARWFVVDHGERIECPQSPPHALERINSVADEFRVESRWQGTVSTQRQERDRTRFRERMTLLFDAQKPLAPFACPTDLVVADVPALDAGLLISAGAPWHFVTDDELEAVLGAGPRHSWNAKPRPPALIVLVDLQDKRLPEQQNPGWARGTLSVVDWVQQKVLCKAELNVVQPENAYRDLSRPDVLMPDFKDRVSQGLANQLTLMTGGSLTLRPTW